MANKKTNTNSIQQKFSQPSPLNTTFTAFDIAVIPTA